jgi:hypothetical protein
LTTPFNGWSLANWAAAIRLGAFILLALLLWIRTGWLAGFLLLFPALGFLPYIPWQGFASRYAYLAALGSTGLAALALAVLWDWRGRLGSIMRLASVVLFVALLWLEIGEMHVRLGYWGELTQKQGQILQDVQAQNLPMPAGSALYFLNSPTRSDYTLQMMWVMIDRSLHANTVDLGPLPQPAAGAPGYIFYYGDAALKTLSFSPDLSRPPANPPLPLRFGPAITLTGYDLPIAMQPGKPFPVLLYWSAAAPVDRSYSVQVHLIDGNGALLAQADGIPQAGQAPTTGWQKGQFAGDYYLLIIPDSLSAGEAHIEVGLYDAATGQHLPVLDQNGNPAGQSLAIGPIPVQ